MKFSFSCSLVFASFIAGVSGQATAPPNGCLVCGDGQVVTAPDAIFDFPGQPAVACDILQNIGLSGQISTTECAFLPPLIASICVCRPGDLPVAAPTPTSSTPITGPVPCPAVPNGGCSICGDGLCVTKPDEIFKFPNQPPVPCGQLQQIGFDGVVTPDQCPFLPDFTREVCGCMRSIPAGAPTGPPPTLPTNPPPAPTASPVKPPSRVPVILPTNVPVNTPTDALPGLTPCPAVPNGGCSICGDGLCVTKPDEIFMFPNQPSVPCGQLQQIGFDGVVTPDQCPFLPDFTREVCGCMRSIPAGAPTGPIASPVKPPTRTPIMAPTRAPFANPTSAPAMGVMPISLIAPFAPVASGGDDDNSFDMDDSFDTDDTFHDDHSDDHHSDSSDTSSDSSDSSDSFDSSEEFFDDDHSDDDHSDGDDDEFRRWGRTKFQFQFPTHLFGGDKNESP